MCFGGGGGQQQQQESPPVAPNPPPVDNTTEQEAPAPSEDDNLANTIKKNKDGTSLLTIPLTNTSGSGVQTGNQ